MIRALLLALLLAATPATAQQGEPMTAEEFRAATEGWTLHFRDAFGEYFGSEQYFSDGRTTWLPRGGTCEQGVWASDGDRICFLYGVGLACWRIYEEGATGLYAESADGDPGAKTRLWLEKRDKSQLLCPEDPGV